MAQYIDKDATIAEIEKLYDEEIDTYTRNILDRLKSNIDTLEVKEMDLKDEVERFAKECGYNSAATIDFQFAKHFFELGLKAQKG